MTLTSAILVCSFLVAVAPAGAQPAGVQADELFRKGRALMAEGKHAEAAAALEQSQRLEPAVATLINLAACHDKLGRLATAWGLFLDAERQTRSSSDPAGQQLHKVAHDLAARIEPRVPRLTIRVPDDRRIDGLEILRDQELVPAAMWNQALPVDGGTYTITARAPGVEDWSTRVTLAPEADARTVDVPDLRSRGRDLDAAPEARLAAARPARPPEPPRPAARRGRLAPLAVGAGAVGLLGGALGLSRWGDATYRDARDEVTDPQRRESLYDSANRKRYAAQGLAAAGVGCAGVAVWLYLRRRGAPDEPSGARARRLMLVPTASGIGVAGRF